MDRQDYTAGGTGATSGSQTTSGEQRIVVDLEDPIGTGTGRAGATGGTSTGSDGQQGGGSAGGIGGAIDNAQERVNQGMKQAAGGLENAAQRLDSAIDSRMGDATGRMGQVSDLGHSFADTMESVAGYLRNNDVDSLRRDLERQMREKPLQTLLVGVAAGWLAGKILR